MIQIDFPDTSPYIWIDVRSPKEYEKGHIPGAYSLPLFNDKERETVGTVYARRGQQTAIKKGLDLIGPKMGDFLRQAESLMKQHPNKRAFMLYCARGGLRSNSMAWLFRLYGWEALVFEGGFRAFRQLLPMWLEEKPKLIIVSGGTGCGKTELLQLLKKSGRQVINLEALANHRGSAFGKIPNAKQPTNEMLLCLLIQEVLKLDLDYPIYVESESKKIGQCELPDAFFSYMRNSPIVQITTSLQERVDRILKDYGQLAPESLICAFTSIAPRMGSENANKAIEMVKNQDLSSAIALALRYYDKLYNKSNRLWKGERLGSVEYRTGAACNVLEALEAIVRSAK